MASSLTGLLAPRYQAAEQSTPASALGWGPPPVQPGGRVPCGSESPTLGQG